LVVSGGRDDLFSRKIVVGPSTLAWRAASYNRPFRWRCIIGPLFKNVNIIPIAAASMPLHLSATPSRSARASQDEPKGRLLRQCADGELLRYVEKASASTIATILTDRRNY